MNLDNISNETLNRLKELYEGKEGFRIVDDRERVAFGEKHDYFLFSYEPKEGNQRLMVKYIWIGGNLWQFHYANINSREFPLWRSPDELLEELLNPSNS